MLAGLPPSTAAYLVNKVCASGMKAVMLAAASLTCGQTDLAVAGGMESMSRCPLYVARTTAKLGDRIAADGILRDGLLCASREHAARHMGDHAECCAAEYGITRNAQDEYALESFRRYHAAKERGVFDQACCE